MDKTSRMRPVALAALLAMTLVAGCLGDDDGERDDAAGGTAQDEAPNATELLTYDATGCSLAVSVLLRDLDHLAGFLPEPFRPADAQGLLGTPVPVGQGGVLATTYTCEDSVFLGGPLAGAEINILVADPGLDADASQVTTHYYLAKLYLPASAALDRFATDGWDVQSADEITNQADALLGGTVRSGDVVANGTLAYGMEVQGAAPSTLAGISRFWQVTPGGPSWFDYDVAAEVNLGTSLITWEAGGFLDGLQADGSALSATAPLEVPGIAVPSFDWQATYRPPGPVPAPAATSS
ncbi:MAG: hypothetical protein ACPGQL_00220 [Thermoplasmatota archaeon]